MGGGRIDKEELEALKKHYERGGLGDMTLNSSSASAHHRSSDKMRHHRKIFHNAIIIWHADS